MAQRVEERIEAEFDGSKGYSTSTATRQAITAGQRGGEMYLGEEHEGLDAVAHGLLDLLHHVLEAVALLARHGRDRQLEGLWDQQSRAGRESMVLSYGNEVRWRSL
jgi:hypothetical protein